ncbi:MAG: tRNA (cytidine(34)-2'-O)-methyltransferase [Nevskia sp.]|nr:tRNA (cytidine(34)-2'-O)-methyltransferase [Nevskia sp.]
MIQVALIEPEIPPNTGNVIRLCANSGAALHLVRPLGFTLDHAKLRRAGLDYHEHAAMQVHDDVAALRAATGSARWFVFTTKGSQRYDQVQWQAGDVLLFGAESRGLPDSLIATVPPERRVYLPQQPGMRSLNLSNAVAVAVYEAWRQLGYAGAREPNS